MIDYESCVVSKVYKIVLKKSPANKAIRLFYYMYIDLFLEIVAYNSNNYMIYIFDEFSWMNKVEIFA